MNATDEPLLKEANQPETIDVLIQARNRMATEKGEDFADSVRLHINIMATMGLLFQAAKASVPLDDTINKAVAHTFADLMLSLLMSRQQDTMIEEIEAWASQLLALMEKTVKDPPIQ
jgi:hypothetical protein